MTAVWLRVAGKLWRAPRLWPTAARQARRLAPPGWWRRRPFVPVPSAGYLHFRLVTQYGDPMRRPDPDDVLNYLRWARHWDALRH